MKTKTTKSKRQLWNLKNKETGKVYSNWVYPSRTAARKAAKGRRFKGLYTPVKSVDIDPKKLKKSKPVPMPKSEKVVESKENGFLDFSSFLEWLMEDELTPVETIKESTPSTMTRPNTNTKPKLRKASSAPGSKFHRHGKFGIK